MMEHNVTCTCEICCTLRLSVGQRKLHDSLKLLNKHGSPMGFVRDSKNNIRYEIHEESIDSNGVIQFTLYKSNIFLEPSYSLTLTDIKDSSISLTGLWELYPIRRDINVTIHFSTNKKMPNRIIIAKLWNKSNTNTFKHKLLYMG